MRKLASIEKILEIAPILGADKIEVASVLGWKVVVEKGKYKVGDKIIYVEIDALLPFADWNSFLFKGSDIGKPTFRLRTIKLRGQVSQGLALPVSIVQEKIPYHPTDGFAITEITEGMGVAELLGVTKYEPPIPTQLTGKMKGSFPSYIPKTDETRIQAVPEVLNEIRGKEVYITMKMDGSSGTFYKNSEEYGVCSRNIEFHEDADNTFWKISRKYNIGEEINRVSKRIALQGEVCGPSIQKNRLGLKDHMVYMFNAYDIQTAKYLDFEHLENICLLINVPMVPLVYKGIFDPSWDIPKLLEMAKGNYPGTTQPREGIVIRPVVETYSPILKGRLSFKVINNDFLLKGGD